MCLELGASCTMPRPALLKTHLFFRYCIRLKGSNPKWHKSASYFYTGARGFWGCQTTDARRKRRHGFFACLRKMRKWRRGPGWSPGCCKNFFDRSAPFGPINRSFCFFGPPQLFSNHLASPYKIRSVLHGSGIEVDGRHRYIRVHDVYIYIHTI